MTDVPATALVVTAHPDDCEFGCAGTLARWAGAGAAVTVTVLTDGSKGSHDPDLDHAVLRDRREAEQRAASAVLGVRDVRFARQVDGELAQGPDIVSYVAGVIRDARPEIVITHDPWRRYELHTDHEAAGLIVRSALYQAREPRAALELAARGLEPWTPRELWLFHPEEPDVVEDISATFERKIEALLCHHSQYETSFGIRGADGERERFVGMVREWAVSLGPGDGVPGETFKRVPLRRLA